MKQTRDFWLITGLDFGRSLKWARQNPSTVSVRLREIHRMRAEQKFLNP